MNVGDLRIEAENFTGTAKTNTGDVEVHGNVGDNANITSNVGDVVVYGELGKDCALRTNVGDVRVGKRKK